MGQVAGADARRGTRNTVPHGQQQSQIDLLAPHQDGTARGRKCSRLRYPVRIHAEITSCQSYKYQDTFHDSPQNPAVSVDVKRVDQVLEAARCQKLVQLHVPHCVPLHLTSFFVSGETQTADNASAFLWIKHTDLKHVKPFPWQFNAEIPLTFIIQTAT